MSEKKNVEKPYSSNLMFFGGVALCLLCVILVTNVGLLTRILTYPLFQSFGLCSYFVCLTIYIIGVKLAFFKGDLEIKHKIRIVGFVLLFIFLLGFISQCYASSDKVILSLKKTNEDGSVYFLDHFVKVSKLPKGFLKEPYIDVFKAYHFGGGFFGYFFVGFLNQFVSVAGTYAILICGIILSLVLIFLPEICIIVKYCINSIKKRKEEKRNSEPILGEEIPHEDDIPLKKDEISTNETSSAIANVSTSSFENNISTAASKERNIAYANSNKITPNTSIVDDNKNDYSMDNGMFISTAPNNFSSGVSKANLFEDDDDYIQSTTPIISNNNVGVNDKLNVSSNISSNPIFEENRNNSIPSQQSSSSNTAEENVSQKKEQMKFDFNDDINKPIEINEKNEIVENNKNNTLDDKTFLKASTPIFQEPTVANNTIVQPSSNVTMNNNLNKNQEANSIIPLDGSRKPRVDFKSPSLEYLNDYETSAQAEENNIVAEQRKQHLDEIFKEFNIDVTINDYIVGPGVTRFNIKYGPSVTSSAISKRIEDISIRLGGVSVRFEPVVAGQSYSGLEIPNAVISTVGFKEVYTSLPSIEKHPLAVAFGKNITGEVIWADLNKFPHALLAGTTGSGKSIYIHSVIMSLIMRNSPDDLKLMLIDPKRVEMMNYEELPHLLCPVITEPDQAKVALSKLIDEMNRRYELFTTTRAGREIEEYNKWADIHNVDRLPYIVAFIDEFADLVDTCKDVSGYVARIAGKSRACGIHLFIATQRPSSNVITGTIKANLPTHIALMCGSYTDSITILGASGAETLLGKGDMLVSCPLISRVGFARLQGCFISSQEILSVVDYLKTNYKVDYNPDFLDLVDHSKEEGQNIVDSGIYANSGSGDDADEKYKSIKSWVMTQEFISMSKIQRECSVGFNRAGRIFKRLQEEGIVASTFDGSKGSKVLVHDEFASFNDETDNIPTSDELAFRK